MKNITQNNIAICVYAMYVCMCLCVCVKSVRVVENAAINKINGNTNKNNNINCESNNKNERN